MHRAENILAHKYGRSYWEWFYQPENFGKTPPRPANEFEQFIADHGTAHRSPGAPALLDGRPAHYFWNTEALKHHIRWFQEMPGDWIKLIFKDY